jgi:hypothetical protein
MRGDTRLQKLMSSDAKQGHYEVARTSLREVAKPDELRCQRIKPASQQQPQYACRTCVCERYVCMHAGGQAQREEGGDPLLVLGVYGTETELLVHLVAAVAELVPTQQPGLSSQRTRTHKPFKRVSLSRFVSACLDSSVSACLDSRSRETLPRTGRRQETMTQHTSGNTARHGMSHALPRAKRGCDKCAHEHCFRCWYRHLHQPILDRVWWPLSIQFDSRKHAL